MPHPRWRMFSVPFLEINDVIMTSLLLLRIIYVLANFLYFIRDLTSYVFFPLSLLWGKFWILPIYLTIWRQITLPCQFNFAPNLKLMSTSLCVIFLAVGWVGEVIVGGLWGLLPGRRKQKKPGLNSVKWVSVKRGLILPITQQ